MFWSAGGAISALTKAAEVIDALRVGGTPPRKAVTVYGLLSETSEMFDI